MKNLYPEKMLSVIGFEEGRDQRQGGKLGGFFTHQPWLETVEDSRGEKKRRDRLERHLGGRIIRTR